MKKIVGIILLLSGFSANAAIITGTGTLNVADDLTILDSGLEFLDVSATTGLQRDFAVTTYSGDGFRLANYAEVIDLFSAFGVDATGYLGGILDLSTTDAQENSFVSFLGSTLSGGRVGSLGWFDFDGDYGNYFCMGPACGSGGSFLNDIGQSQNSIVGTLLVRNSVVSEPSIVFLMGLGLVGLGFAQRFRNKA